MEIERPETLIDIPVGHELLLAPPVGPQTIGQFYGVIRNKIIRQAGERHFYRAKAKAVTEFFGGGAKISPSATGTQHSWRSTRFSSREKKHRNPQSIFRMTFRIITALSNSQRVCS
jgi:hypothetical protein